jgi:glucose/arabinose dehydrogenase
MLASGQAGACCDSSPGDDSDMVAPVSSTGARRSAIGLIAACALILTACADDGPYASIPRLEQSEAWSAPRQEWSEDFTVSEWSVDRFEGTDLQFLPDGRAILLTKGGWAGPGTGHVTLLSSDGATVANLLDIPVCTDNERGLLGLEIDPDFDQNHLIYLFYTRQMNDCAMADGSQLDDPPLPVFNRLSSFVFDEAGIDPASEQVLLDDLPGHQSSHNSGGLAFMGDGSLLVTVGEGAYRRSRDLDFVAGKLLRLDVRRPGEGMSDNPFFDPAQPSAVRSLVYASGLRNAFRLGVDEATGRVALGDVGTEQYEEVNLVSPGDDLGFPDGEGPEPVDGAVGSSLWYTHAEGCNSVIGGEWVPAGFIPFTDQSGYAFSDFGCGGLFVAFFEDRTVDHVAVIAEPFGHAVAAVRFGPDGSLYVVGIGPGPMPVLRVSAP